LDIKEGCILQQELKNVQNMMNVQYDENEFIPQPVKNIIILK